MGKVSNVGYTNTMSDVVVDLYSWYGQRELSFCPSHFVICDTPLTNESLNWVIGKLKGRYAILTQNTTMLNHFSNKIAFEDSKEAMFYELTWS